MSSTDSRTAVRRFASREPGMVAGRGVSMAISEDTEAIVGGRS